MEHTDVAISIAGSAVKSSEVRNSASRVALPPTNCAITAAAQIIVVAIDRVMFPNATRCRKPRNWSGQAAVSRPEVVAARLTSLTAAGAVFRRFQLDGRQVNSQT